MRLPLICSMRLCGAPMVRGSSKGWRKSPCPLVTVIMAPEGQMRGPTTMPMSMACFRPQTGPPRSRTVVKPRISVSVASAPASRLMKPTSPMIAATGVGRTSMVCQWASMSPGIRVRPLPAMTVTAGPAAIGAEEMRSIRLPRTSTLARPDSPVPLPSNTRTFSNSVAGTGRAAAAAVAAATGASCAMPGPERPSVANNTASVRNNEILIKFSKPENSRAMPCRAYGRSAYRETPVGLAENVVEASKLARSCSPHQSPGSRTSRWHSRTSHP